MGRGVHDDVFDAWRGDLVEHFTFEEWCCARFLWHATGRRGGPIEYFFMTPAGELAADAEPVLAEIVERCPAAVFPRALNAHIEHAGTAGAQVLELVKKEWSLPYLHDYDSGSVVKQGTKRLGAAGDPGMPRVPRLGDVTAVRSAYEKLRTLVANVAAGPLSFETVGDVYKKSGR